MVLEAKWGAGTVRSQGEAAALQGMAQGDGGRKAERWLTLGKEWGSDARGGEEENDGVHDHLRDEKNSLVWMVGAEESRGGLAA